MGRLRLVIAGIVLVSVSGSAQFKAQTESRPRVSESLVRSESSNLLFGWFDPSRFMMRQSYSLSYMNIGGQGLSLGTYTNSLFYRIADPLDVQFDISLQHSPFSSFGNTKDLSGIFLSRAELNYRPSENTLLQVQFRQLPSMYWWGMNRSSMFLDGPGGFHEEQH